MHDKLILRVLEVLAASSDASDSEVVAALVADGVGRVRAEKLAALVPLAFGRVLIEHMAMKVTVSMYAVIGGPNGDRIDLRLESIFLRSIEIATIMLHEGPRYLFQPAATASAEVQAINSALHSGIKELKGSTLSDPMLMRLTAREWREDG